MESLTPHASSSAILPSPIRAITHATLNRAPLSIDAISASAAPYTLTISFSSKLATSPSPYSPVCIAETNSGTPCVSW